MIVMKLHLHQWGAVSCFCCQSPACSEFHWLFEAGEGGRRRKQYREGGGGAKYGSNQDQEEHVSSQSTTLLGLQAQKVS